MNKAEVIEHLTELAKQAAECTHHPLHCVSIKLGKERRPRYSRMHIAGRRSPKGEILCRNSQGEWVVSVDAFDMLAWCMVQLKKLGVQVEIRTPDEKP